MRSEYLVFMLLNLVAQGLVQPGFKIGQGRAVCAVGSLGRQLRLCKGRGLVLKLELQVSCALLGLAQLHLQMRTLVHEGGLRLRSVRFSCSLQVA